MGRRLGQHFLKNVGVARVLVHAAEIAPNDVVLEIGPGKGILTRELLATGARVIAIEKDEGLATLLRGKFADEMAASVLTVVPDDIRNISPENLGLQNGRYIVAANIPYYITGEIMRQFLTAHVQPRTMALLVQKEVAQRIVSSAPSGGGSASGGKESILSLSVKAYGTPKIAAKVARRNFSPPPSVDSAILVVEHISRDFFIEIDEKTFFEIVRAGFSTKRKLLRRNLENNIGFTKPYIIQDAFRHCGIGEKARAEEVPLEKWKCLAQELATGV